MAEPITSTANPRIKTLARLKTRRGRNKSGRFLIEGHRELERAHAASVTIGEVVVAPELAGEREFRVAALLENAGASVLDVGIAAFEKLSFRSHPGGLLGVAEHRDPALGDVTIGKNALVLILDGIEKPGNLGAIVRSADGAGVDAVIVTNARVEPTNPNAIRASQGAVFSVPLVVAGDAEVRRWVDAHRLRIVAASPEAESAVWDANLTGGVALVIGAEAAGLGATFRTPDAIVHIPMAGGADSLNSSVAAGIMLYEAVRQRS